MIAYKLARGVIVFSIYVISRLFCLYSRLNRRDTLRNLELTYIVPFKYMLLTRLGEAYIVESALFRRYYDIALHPNSVVIDVGAHIGTFTVRACRKIAGKGLVVAIEPEPINAWHLVINLSINKCKNVKVMVRVACSDSDGYDFLYLHGFTGHSIVLHSKERIPVRTLRLDTLTSILKRFSSDIKIYIKMNAEGAELKILRGATETLRHCDGIVVAAHHYPHQARDVGVFLRKMGFVTKVIEVKGNKLVIGLKPSA
jgi:FkbM family methyltransferase